MTQTRKAAFTLVELLVVVAIIAILAAILVPVFAQVMDKARMSSCTSNTKQLGTAFMMYAQDYDETFPYSSGVHNMGSGPWGPRYDTSYVWPFLVAPYLKNWDVLVCPSDQGEPYARNVADYTSTATNKVPYRVSYGPNEHIVVSAPVRLAQLERPAQKILAGESLNPYACCASWANDYWRAANYYNKIVQAKLGWSWSQMRDLVQRGNVTDDQMKYLTRHQLGQMLIFCDGHSKWYRWNQVGNSRPTSAEWRAMVDPAVP